MAYFYKNSEDGSSGIGGEPSKEERHHGKVRNPEEKAEVLTPEEVKDL